MGWRTRAKHVPHVCELAVTQCVAAAARDYVQRTAEELEYSELLDQAAEFPAGSMERLLRVAAFAVRCERRPGLWWQLGLWQMKGGGWRVRMRVA